MKSLTTSGLEYSGIEYILIFFFYLLNNNWVVAGISWRKSGYIFLWDIHLTKSAIKSDGVSYTQYEELVFIDNNLISLLHAC